MSSLNFKIRKQQGAHHTHLYKNVPNTDCKPQVHFRNSGLVAFLTIGVGSRRQNVTLFKVVFKIQAILSHFGKKKNAENRRGGPSIQPFSGDFLIFFTDVNEKDELFQYHYKNHLLEILHFVIPGHQCFISLADIHQQDLLI